MEYTWNTFEQIGIGEEGRKDGGVVGRPGCRWVSASQWGLFHFFLSFFFFNRNVIISQEIYDGSR